MPKDYYKVLGIAQNATRDDVKKAYRKLAHQYHPDKGGDEKRFKEVNEAYQVLSDEKKRAQYDEFGRVFESADRPSGRGQGGFSWPGGFRVDFGEGGGSEAGGFADFDFSDIMEDFFGAGARSRRTSAEHGRDIRMRLEIAFGESIMGAKKEVELARLARCSRCGGSGGEPGTELGVCQACQGKGHMQKTQRTFLGSFTQVSTCQDCRGQGKRSKTLCSDCRGKGVAEKEELLEVFIPRGVADGEVLKITGKGDAVSGGRTPGDLYIEIGVLAHPVFRRQGDDIVMQLPIKLSRAALGGALDIETLDGEIRLKIPEGTQSGDILNVRGKGAWRASGYGRGDLLVEIKVETPKAISKRAKELIKQLAEEEM